MVTFESDKKGVELINYQKIKEEWKIDLTPMWIRKYLRLTEPKFYETAKWWHFWNGFAWDSLTD